MEKPIRYLTKSRFKLACDCPRKLYYTGKADYLDRSLEDSFLAALAEGGYQVGELACLMHPEGIRVDDLNHISALATTAKLLEQHHVTIFEAALSVDSLFIRVDILRKNGKDVELIEVKAKSYSAAKDGDFRGAKGQLKKDFLPYLQDVAFQRYVAQRAIPGHQIRAFLMLANKEQQATVDGLNQRFKATRVNGRLWVKVAEGTRLEGLGEPLLTKVAVDSQVNEILAGTLMTGQAAPLPFPEAVRYFAKGYADDQPLSPVPAAACADCQFNSISYPSHGGPKSGFHECWKESFGWEDGDFQERNVLDLWNFTGKNTLIQQGILKTKQVSLEDLGFDGEPPSLSGMTRKHRQWYLCQPDWPGGGEYFFDKEGFLETSAKWKYPLHCIDFETSTVAIPFVKGRRPYETTAFQFSHHVIAGDGVVVHQSQFICAQPGVDPNIAFTRALRDALSGNDGTIFRWAMHENSVLNQLRVQMLQMAEPPADLQDLVSFIEQITTRPGEGKIRLVGPRNMVDLCEIAEKFYFHPSTKGSNSLKKVLPALMGSSPHLRNVYGQATYGGTGVSLNFKEPIAWWQMRDGIVADPYSLLPPIFDDVSSQEVEAAEDGLSEELREGGAAMAAYGRLQFEDLAPHRRDAIEAALLRYCELDTLAMVMAVQAWQADAR